VAVSDVIERAREIHPAFGTAFNPERVLLSFMSRYRRQLVAKIAAINPDEVSTWQTISLPLAVFANGVAVADAFLWLGGDARPSGSTLQREVEFHLIPHAHRYSAHVWPRGWVVNGTLYLAGEATDWTGFDQISLRYVPMSADYTAGTDAIGVPDTAIDVMVYALADFMAQRTPAPRDGAMWNAPDRRLIRADFQSSEDRFLSAIGLRKHGLTATTQDVW
jgi:hypothetical protein